MTRGKIIGDAPCPSCRAMGRDSTGNHLILFDNGGSYCNRCGYTESRHAASEVPCIPTKRSSFLMNPSKETLEEILEYPTQNLSARSITRDTCEYFNTRVSVSTTDGTTQEKYFFPYYKDRKLVGFKVRIISPKSFYAVGNTQGCQLFGQEQALGTGSKTLYITEGECDAMALYQVLRDQSTLDNWHPAVVSVPNGAKSAAKSIAEQYDFVTRFEKVVFVFDNDEAGQEGLSQACHVIPERAYVVKLPLKDPNDMLLQGKGSELKWLCMKPKQYQPDNIVRGEDAWDAYLAAKDVRSIPYPPSYTDLNYKTYGVRYGSVVTIASGSGCGKTQFMRELKYHYFNNTEDKIADIALEEGIKDTMDGMFSIHLNKRIQLPDVDVTEEEERRAFEDIYESGRWSLYDHFGGMDDDNLFAKLRYFAATGHKFIFLDHLSIIVSEYAAQGGERERIDTIMTRLAKLAKEFGVIIFLIVHLRKSGEGKAFEEGRKPTVDDLRGSGSIKQLSWDILFLTRNLQHPDPVCRNTSLISVGKCRFTGRTGDSDYLFFDEQTGRMVKTERPFGWDVKEFEKKEHRGQF